MAVFMCFFSSYLLTMVKMATQPKRSVLLDFFAEIDIRHQDKMIAAVLKSSHEGPESQQGLNSVTFPQINQRMKVCGVLENYLDILVV